MLELLKDFTGTTKYLQSLNFFQKKGFSIKVVTNQSGIQRGYYSLVDYTKICIHMLKEFERIGIDIEIRACPHRPETNCECRKPNIGMFLDDRHEEDIMIGDQNSDMLAAKNAGIKKIGGFCQKM